MRTRGTRRMALMLAIIVCAVGALGALSGCNLIGDRKKADEAITAAIKHFAAYADTEDKRFSGLLLAWTLRKNKIAGWAGPDQAKEVLKILDEADAAQKAALVELEASRSTYASILELNVEEKYKKYATLEVAWAAKRVEVEQKRTEISRELRTMLNVMAAGKTQSKLKALSAADKQVSALIQQEKATREQASKLKDEAIAHMKAEW